VSVTIVYDGTFRGAYVRTMGPGIPEGGAMGERTNSPEVAASARTYKPGEVEEIAVAAVVREALWKVATRMEGDPTIEQLVDEAAMSAAKVMMRAALPVCDPPNGFASGGRVVPEGWRGRLANVERLLVEVEGAYDAAPGSDWWERGSEALGRALAEVRSLLDFE
jgi:hypothetical protein